MFGLTPLWRIATVPLIQLKSLREARPYRSHLRTRGTTRRRARQGETGSCPSFRRVSRRPWPPPPSPSCCKRRRSPRARIPSPQAAPPTKSSEDPAFRRPRGFRGRDARLHRHGARCAGARHRPAAGLEPKPYDFLKARSAGRQCQPEPVAPGAAQPHPRPVQGDRSRLPGARLRPRQHDHHRRRQRPDPDRPAARRRDRARGARALSTSTGRRSRWAPSSTPTATPTTSAASRA